MSFESGSNPSQSTSAPTQSAVVARIPYLNAAPFYARWSELPADSQDLVPRVLGQEAREGRVDAGLMAIVDYFSLEEEFERIGNLAIACTGEVESVVLFSSGPIVDLDCGRIILTSESSTSVELCRLLLHNQYGLKNLSFERRTFDPTPGETPEIAGGEAWLLIGDAALMARRRHPQLLKLDLGAAWTEWTDLPFVYAVWAVRKSLGAEPKQALETFLTDSLEIGEGQLGEIAQKYAARTADALGSARELEEYLKRFTYRARPTEEAGLNQFKHLLGEHTREQGFLPA